MRQTWSNHPLRRVETNQYCTLRCASQVSSKPPQPWSNLQSDHACGSSSAACAPHTRHSKSGIDSRVAGNDAWQQPAIIIETHTQFMIYIYICGKPRNYKMDGNHHRQTVGLLLAWGNHINTPWVCNRKAGVQRNTLGKENLSRIVE